MKKAHGNISRILVALAITAGASLACSSEQPVVEEGAYVRATTYAPDINTLGNPEFESVLRSTVITGNLLGLTDTAVTLVVHGHELPVTIPLHDLDRLELNRRQGQRRQGALIGLCAGAVTGALSVLVYDAYRDKDPESWDLLGTEMAATFVAFYFGAAGAVIGALVSPGAQWQPIPIEDLHIGIGSSHHGEGRLFVSMGF